MENYTVVLKDQITEDSLKELVKAAGGYWMTMPTKPDFEQGVIERGPAAVLVSYSDDAQVSVPYDPEEVEFLRRHLGVEPKVAIGLAVRRNPESEELAKEIAEKIIAMWGGYLDRGMETLGGQDITDDSHL